MNINKEEIFMAKKVSVNKDLCIGCGLCTTIAPDVLAIGDDGLAGALVSETEDEAVEEAAASCPVAAIVVE